MISPGLVAGSVAAAADVANSPKRDADATGADGLFAMIDRSDDDEEDVSTRDGVGESSRRSVNFSIAASSRGLLIGENMRGGNMVDRGDGAPTARSRREFKE